MVKSSLFVCEQQECVEVTTPAAAPRPTNIAVSQDSKRSATNNLGSEFRKVLRASKKKFRSTYRQLVRTGRDEGISWDVIKEIANTVNDEMERESSSDGGSKA